MKKILISTGGSGGHVMPALSIYDHLKLNFDVFLLTDRRGARFINQNKYKFEIIDVPNIFSNIYLLPLNLIKFILSILRSYVFLKKNNIDFLISTGGYMSFPISIASRILKIKIYLFEPNSVLGRSNKFLLPFSEKIICYDKDLKLFPNKLINKIYEIETILRKEIYTLKKFEKKENLSSKSVLILGGSQGAKFFDRNITELLIKISENINLEVIQQVYSNEEKTNIEQKYRKAGIKFNLFDFEENFFQKFNNIDIAITRSGASTISELAFLNIPFIAIPFPFAKDNHQYFNASFYKNRDCCWVINQENFDIVKIKDLIIQIFNEKNEYIKKKQNLINLSNQNTWNNINKKLLKLFDEN